MSRKALSTSSSLAINFEGRFQCRLATDPDRWDDPRGENGWTFAFPGEPDLDRVIRFQNPIAPRSRTPTIGVSITAVSIDGNTSLEHVLIGAPVELIDDAVFEGRNGKIARAAHEPIVPFHILIKKGSLLVGRKDDLDLSNKPEIARRQPIAFDGDSEEVKTTTGVRDFAGYRQARMKALENDLAASSDAIEKSRLQMRIDQLKMAGSIQETSLGFQVSYKFDIRSASEYQDPANLLQGKLDTAMPWSIQFWMGGWDADALAAYVKGVLTVPIVIS